VADRCELVVFTTISARSAQLNRYEIIEIMIVNLIKAYWELNFKFYAYLVGNVYIAPCYLIGFVIPTFKKVIHEYETSGNTKAISVISFVSGSLIYGCLFFLDPNFSRSIHEIILWYIGSFIWGFYALYHSCPKNGLR
jgi:hypothetical protein